MADACFGLGLKWWVVVGTRNRVEVRGISRWVWNLRGSWGLAVDDTGSLCRYDEWMSTWEECQCERCFDLRSPWARRPDGNVVLLPRTVAGEPIRPAGATASWAR